MAKDTLDLEEVQDIELEQGRGKYRSTIEKFLASGMKKAKITFKFGARAVTAKRLLTQWTADDEYVLITKRGRTVYLVRTDIGE